MLWEEVAIIQEVGEVIRRGGGSTAYVKGNPWEKTREQFHRERRFKNRAKNHSKANQNQKRQIQEQAEISELAALRKQYPYNNNNQSSYFN